MNPLLDPNLGPGDEYMYECLRCKLSRHTKPDQEFASYSRDHDVIVAAAKRHFDQTGHRVQMYLKKLILEIY